MKSRLAPEERCPECLAMWGQVPHPWGDSRLELDAYDEHVREHEGATCPRCGRISHGRICDGTGAGHAPAPEEDRDGPA